MSKARCSILVTGGCGFIGSNLVVRLLEENYQITVLDNLSVGKKENVPSNVDLVIGDIRDEKLIAETMDDVDAVVHLAAHTDVIKSIEDPELDFNINAKGTFNLLHWSNESDVEKFILASSNATVGEQNPPITENAVPAPLSPYGASKLSSEALCSAFSGSYGLKTISLRFANAYGPYSFHKSSVVAKFLRRALKNEELTIYGDGNQTRDFIHVDDICQAILLAIENNSTNGVFQIGTGSETKIIDLAKKIKNITFSNSEIVFVTPRKGEIIRNYTCIDKARNILGFEPQVDLDTGLVQTCDWFERELRG